MKKFGKLSLGALALLMSACSSDEPIAPDNSQVPGGENDIYASLTLRLPSSNGTRGVTETGEYYNDGIEIGQDYENKVSNVLVVLATREGNTFRLLTKSVSDIKELSGENEIKYTLTFKSSEMTPDALDEDSKIPGTQSVYVFAYCNPSAKLLELADNWETGNTSFINQVANIYKSDNRDQIDGTMWTPDKFLMTNCELSAPIDIPARTKLVKEHGTAENAFPLGTVKVKRAAARFDFMTTTTSAGLNKYPIIDSGTKENLGTVELTDMAMFNLNKFFYYLPRTNDTWNWGNASMSSGSITLCGDLEGYVVSPNNDNWKGNGTLRTDLINNNYFFNLTTGNLNGLEWVSLRNWNENNKLDNHEGWEHPDKNLEHDYRIWRYVTENTIPQHADNATMSQRAGISTGVVFRGEFTPSESQQSIWNGNTVYFYNGIVYGDYETLKKHVEDFPNTAIADDFKAVSTFQSPGAKDPKANLLSGLSKEQRHGFTAYVPTMVTENGKDVYKYVMYYYYYNRHNTNGVNTSMGINEFGVVRNNVYKLRVTTVGTFGRPDVPEKEEPNEEESAYFTVSCIVMPWTVRVNDIDF